MDTLPSPEVDVTRPSPQEFSNAIDSFFSGSHRCDIALKEFKKGFERLYQAVCNNDDRARHTINEYYRHATDLYMQKKIDSIPTFIATSQPLTTDQSAELLSFLSVMLQTQQEKPSHSLQSAAA